MAQVAIVSGAWLASRENDPHVHAEESALAKLPGDPRLPGATIYSALEPCSARKSRPLSCTQLIIASGIRRVVIAWREPSLFVADARGYELLEQAGLEVSELPSFTERAKAPNQHLPLSLRRDEICCGMRHKSLASDYANVPCYR